MVSFYCSTCKTQLQMPDESVGKKVRCPKCKTVLTIPTNPVKPASAPSRIIHVSPKSLKSYNRSPVVSAGLANEPPQTAELADLSALETEQKAAPAVPPPFPAAPPLPSDDGTYGLADDPKIPPVRIDQEQPVDNLSMLNQSAARPRRSSAKVIKPEAGETSRTSGIISILMSLVVVCMFFAPWIKIFIIELSPLKMVELMLKSSSGGTKMSIDSVMVLSQSAYTIGMVLAGIGACITLSAWKSIMSICGFIGCIIGCVIFGLSWFSRSNKPNGFSEAMESIDAFGLTPWFYMAAIASIIGLVVAIMAMKRGRKMAAGY